MNESAENVITVTMPQVNVNDEEVTLIGWHVEDGGQAVADQPLCEVETSKSTGDVPSPASGVFRRAVEVGQVVAVGQVIGYIGPSAKAIEEYIAAHPVVVRATTSVAPVSTGPVEATAGAIELARSHGIDLSRISAQGKIRRADVERYIADHPGLAKASPSAAATAPESLPAALRSSVNDEGDLPDHLWSIAQHLTATQHRLAVAHVVMDVSMVNGLAWMDAQRKAGRMAGPIPLLLHAAAAAATACPQLISFRIGRRVYRYAASDIAYTARTPDGRLFTPVVRNVAGRSLDDLAADCARLSMSVFRGELDPRDMTGGAMTVSALTEQPVNYHVGLQNAYQSALLTAGAIRDDLVLVDDKPTNRPTITLVLSYDHGLMDGYEAAKALAAARAALEHLTVR